VIIERPGVIRVLAIQHRPCRLALLHAEFSLESVADEVIFVARAGAGHPAGVTSGEFPVPPVTALCRSGVVVP